jgi:hypothetical protein
VAWKKNIHAQEMFQIVQRVNLPFICHFRIASAGGVCPELCHPFPVTVDANLGLEGKASRVLFHNGTYQDWKESCMQMILSRKLYIPKGIWSDSRALAWMAFHCGHRVLGFVNGKIVVFSAKSIKLFGNWVEENGISYSNTFFRPAAQEEWSKKPATTNPFPSGPFGVENPEGVEVGPDTEEDPSTDPFFVSDEFVKETETKHAMIFNWL